MSDAPERIWAFLTDIYNTRGYFSDEREHKTEVEYIRADLARLKVKPLEFFTDDNWSTAESILGDYDVYFDPDYGWLCLLDGSDDSWVKYPDSEIGFGSEPQAIRACQEHFEARILSALEGYE